MFQFRHDFIKYFDERFSFFGFSLPLLILIFPIIPNLVPLYFLPNYYGLIVSYLFLIIFNLRLYRDIMEKRVTKVSFSYLYLMQTLVLFSFSFLFHFLEMQRYLPFSAAALKLNWRSFFFFLSTLSIVSMSWFWYGVLRPLIKRSYLTELIPMIKYPLFLIPPVLLRVHKSQIEELVFYALVIFIHAVCFELLKNDFLKKLPLHLNVSRGFLLVYSFLIGPGFYFFHHDLILSSVLGTFGLIFMYKARNLEPRLLFLTTIVFNWAALFI